MTCYLGAPLSLAFGAGEGAPTLCSKDGHGPWPAGATGKEEGQEDATSQWVKDYSYLTQSILRGIVCRRGYSLERACSGHHSE